MLQVPKQLRTKQCGQHQTVLIKTQILKLSYLDSFDVKLAAKLTTSLVISGGYDTLAFPTV